MNFNVASFLRMEFLHKMKHFVDLFDRLSSSTVKTTSTLAPSTTQIGTTETETAAQTTYTTTNMSECFILFNIIY